MELVESTEGIMNNGTYNGNVLRTRQYTYLPLRVATGDGREPTTWGWCVFAIRTPITPAADSGANFLRPSCGRNVFLQVHKLRTFSIERHKCYAIRDHDKFSVHLSRHLLYVITVAVTFS